MATLAKQGASGVETRDFKHLRIGETLQASVNFQSLGLQTHGPFPPNFCDVQSHKDNTKAVTAGSWSPPLGPSCLLQGSSEGLHKVELPSCSSMRASQRCLPGIPVKLLENIG